MKPENETAALAALAAALENAKWKLPPAVGELTAFLQKELTGVRREALTGEAFLTQDKTDALRRTAAQLCTAAADAQLAASPEAAAALITLCTAAAVASAAIANATDVNATMAVATDANATIFNAVAAAANGTPAPEPPAAGAARQDWLNALGEVIAALCKLCGAASAVSAPSAQVAGLPLTATSAAAGSVPAASTVGTVTSAQAQTLCSAVLARARAEGLRLVTAVCDAGGNLLAFCRDDDAFIASIDIAINKAFTSVSLKMPTKQLAALAAPGGSLYGIQHTNNGRMVIFGGGVPLMRGGRVIGGFGVSGGTAEQDTAMGDFAAQVAQTICG